MQDHTHATEQVNVGVTLTDHEPIQWRARWSVHKYDDSTGVIAAALQNGVALDTFTPTEVIEQDGNLLMFGGASCLWQCLIGNGTTSAGQALTFFNNAQAAIGVGDSVTAAAGTQTDLQAATNKLRKAMDATYPQHTDATTSGAASIVFRSTFATTDANFAWQEWIVAN